MAPRTIRSPLLALLLAAPAALAAPPAPDNPLTRGVACVRNGDGPCAVTLLLPLLAEPPDNAQRYAAIRYSLARGYELSGRHLEAAETYLTVLALDEGLPQNVRNSALESLRAIFTPGSDPLARLEAEPIEPDRLRTLITRAARDPIVVNGARIVLGAALRRLGSAAAAIDTYDAIIADPAAPPAMQALAHQTREQALAATLARLVVPCPPDTPAEIRAAIHGPRGAPTARSLAVACGTEAHTLDPGDYSVVLWGEVSDLGARRVAITLVPGQKGVMQYSLPSQQVGVPLAPFFVTAGLGAVTTLVALKIDDPEPRWGVAMGGAGLALGALVGALIAELAQRDDRHRLIVTQPDLVRDR